VSDEIFALQVGFYEEEDVIGAFSDAALPVLDRAEGDAAADVAESCLRKPGSFAERLQSLGDRLSAFVKGFLKKIFKNPKKFFRGAKFVPFVPFYLIQ
jgi:hypothetical protein